MIACKNPFVFMKFMIAQQNITTNTEGRVGILNTASETLTGWRQDEARSKPIEEVFRIINKH